MLEKTEERGGAVELEGTWLELSRKSSEKVPSPQGFLAFDQVSARTENPAPATQNVIIAARSLWGWAAGSPRGKQILEGPLHISLVRA